MFAVTCLYNKNMGFASVGQIWSGVKGQSSKQPANRKLSKYSELACCWLYLAANCGWKLRFFRLIYIKLII